MASSRLNHSTPQPLSQPPSQPKPQSPTTPNPSSRFTSSARLPPLSQANTPSASLVSSTAQGHPIPLSDTNTADHTTTLRELSRSQPTTRHRYSKSSGPPPSTAGTAPGTTTGTYSQPILVRTYSGPISPPASARSTSRREAVPSVESRPSARASGGGRRHHGFGVTLIRPLIGRKPSPADDAKLPRLEAFSFKNIMAEIEQDIGADLDRIADICARSRYSLSNQYEIHVAPHGSGASFAQVGPASASTNLVEHNNGGPTLQAISIDDGHNAANHGRRIMVRRRSAAYGTLETIISSSRSSDDDRNKRKSAAEIAAQVRGRISHPSPEGSGSVHSTEAQASSEPPSEQTKKPPRARSTLAAAILGHSRAHTYQHPDLSPRTSGTDLVGEPATPETSHNHLLNATATHGLAREDGIVKSSTKEQTRTMISASVTAAAIAAPDEPKDQPGLLGGFRFSLPWGGSSVADRVSADQKSRRTKSYAEGTLRQLLRVAEPPGARGGKSADGEEAGAG